MVSAEFQPVEVRRVLEVGGGDGSHDSVNALHATKLCLKMVKMADCMLCVFYHHHFKKNFKRTIARATLHRSQGRTWRASGRGRPQFFSMGPVAFSQPGCSGAVAPFLTC